VFDVNINGIKVLTNFDIFAKAGGANKAIAESFTARATSSATIDITLTTVRNYAMINGIEITLDTAATPAPTATPEPTAKPEPSATPQPTATPVCLDHLRYDDYGFKGGEFQENGFDTADWTTYHKDAGRIIYENDAFYNDSTQFPAYPTIAVGNDPVTGDQNVLQLSAFPIPSPIATNPAFALTNGQPHNGPPFVKYFSAYIETSGIGQFQQRYGYWDARIREPKGQGLWPGFFMFSSLSDAPAKSEWDIAELIDQDLFINEQIWIYLASGGVVSGINGGSGYKSSAPSIHVSFDPSVAYHDYGILILPSGVSFYIDGNKIAQNTTSTDATTAHGQYIVLALQIGDVDSWPGTVNSSTVFPAKLFIQHVRVFKPTTTGC
jgi:hypothetical protein